MNRYLPQFARALGSIWWKTQTRSTITMIIPLHDKFLQFDWLRAVVFQLNLKYLHVKITVSMALQKISHEAV